MGHTLSGAARRLSETGAPQAEGALARVDPRARILAALLFAVVTVALSTLTALLAALGGALALLALSPMPARRTLRRMILMDGFILFMLVLLPFTVPGEAIFTLWGLTASWQGLAQAIEIGLTANAVVLALMVLVGSMEPVTLGHALHALRCPERLVHLMMFTIRYIEVLHEEYQRLRVSMKVRGFRPGTNWHTYRSIGYLVGMMLVRAIERSERILDAMKCRGFDGRIPLLERFAYARRDAVFAGAMLALCALLGAVEVLA
ncbi:cobalt ECF transporter T component CbiQ [Pseudoponticoccus marisrubri]|uniref:Cobalt ABC transporter permease n=1 Tax=Pseudoponticoccus marisrubri TaxID=1685382 RepID=A0A0W7WPL5_9RHOB|nr:cobalt ECF transporter T component CbiQ [Pseudoponticoccus marisrubri]KUF12440.1 cobalt ABC transporter permease [Pseudoponticoccus marisrubri]